MCAFFANEPTSTREMPVNAITQTEIDQQVFGLYDEYCHGEIDRREFLKRAGALGAAAEQLFPVTFQPAVRQVVG